MTALNSLEGLRGLHQDLIALDESQLRNIERLWAELEARVDEFRKLLDKAPKNDTSRKTLLSGRTSLHIVASHRSSNKPLITSLDIGNIQLDEEEYSLNTEFIEGTLQLADALDLDELDSARLLLDAQQDTEVLDRSNLVSAVIRFHEQRQFLVECLRLVMKCSADPACENDTREVLRQLISLILEIKDGPARNGSLYARKCLGAMADCEKWLQALGERYQGSLTLGQTLTPEYNEILEFQQLSLEQQHESLAAVLTHLVKANYTGVEDFYKLLEHLPRLEKWNSIIVHYVPVITAFTSQYGSSEGSASLREARLLNSKITDGKDSAPWNLQNLQAATITWWLAEYSGWYHDKSLGSPVQGVDLGAEAEARSDTFFRALRDGAFQCTLSFCSQIRSDEWPDQMRNGLTQHLLRDAPAFVNGAASTSSYFQDLAMEQIETFVDAFITNMPDTLRKFKSEEDDQRKRISQLPINNGITEQDLHLERFLLIIACASENRIEAAESFWSDPDSNLFGFLQWASKRQSTPMVGAYCEMLRSISRGEECATSAHQFLLEEGSATSARTRRSNSLSWNQITAELNLYTSKIGEHSINLRTPHQYISRPSSDDIDEPESDLMLECYLRLTSQICCESAAARSWILSHPSFRVLEVMFLLCNSAVPSRLRACAFSVTRALLTDSATEINVLVWTSLDQWVSGGLSPNPNIPRPAKTTNASGWIEDITLDAIANDIEESSEFIALLKSLVSPAIDELGLNDSLPFPEQLGSTYRMSGIDPYVDFVMGKVFALQVPQQEDSPRLKVLRLRILDFVATCLETFNEDLVILANRSNLSVDTAMNTSSLTAYLRLHPFSRVMEWMFNERVLVALFAVAHQDIDKVSTGSPDSPLLLSLLRSIDIMNLVIDLQSTYLNIVRPLIKLQSSGRSQQVLNPSLASFEDSVVTKLHIIVDLGLYCGIGMQQLTVSSLKLLEKLASSRKLNFQPAPGLSQRMNGNRLIGVLEQNNDLERIARSLTLAMQFDLRELSLGIEAPGWTIKLVILDFLNRCLTVSPDKPSLAHALLGFHCTGSDLNVENDSLFARGTSLFHAVLRLVADYPDGVEGTMQSWLLSIKQKGLQVLSTLWASPLTSIFTLTELRTTDFLFVSFINQSTIEPNTLWDGKMIRDLEFLYSESAIAFEQYLKQRCFLCNYTSAEVRLIAIEDIPSFKARTISTLLGSTSMPDGEQIVNLTIFDLLDFVDLDLFACAVSPEPFYFSGIDFTVTAGLELDDGSGDYNLKMVEEMMSLHLNQMRKNGRLQEPSEEQGALAEAQSFLLYFHGINNYRRLSSSRSLTMKAWVDLVALVITHCGLDQNSKASLILQSFQVILPKLERCVAESITEATELASLVNTLLLQFDFASSVMDGARSGDAASDRLFQVFRVALRAINVPDGDAQLREILYNICYRYLIGMAEISSKPIRRRHSIQTVKANGEKLIDVICDEAHGGSGTCRISALLLLDSLVALAKVENSNYLTDSLMRTNFVLVLVETIQDIPQELRETNARGEHFCPRMSIVAILTTYTWQKIYLSSYHITKANSHSY